MKCSKSKVGPKILSLFFCEHCPDDERFKCPASVIERPHSRRRTPDAPPASHLPRFAIGDFRPLPAAVPFPRFTLAQHRYVVAVDDNEDKSGPSTAGTLDVCKSSKQAFDLLPIRVARPIERCYPMTLLKYIIVAAFYNPAANITSASTTVAVK